MTGGNGFFKGGIISESYSFWLKSPKNGAKPLSWSSSLYSCVPNKRRVPIYCRNGNFQTVYKGEIILIYCDLWGKCQN